MKKGSAAFRLRSLFSPIWGHRRRGVEVPRTTVREGLLLIINMDLSFKRMPVDPAFGACL